MGLFRELPDTRLLWFSGSPLSALLPTSSTSLEELAGTLLGLATYNGVMMELTLAPVVYRLLMDCPVTLRDLQLQEPRLGTGLRQLL
ncbi:MAG: hypothetical protein ACK41Y_16315, partial [Paracoccus hibiscisoli]|uniref:hypothetical protein n=1 Tax=Paracoccus hibiscisoli TaxID=2023261 RepID=UPI00391A11A4